MRPTINETMMEIAKVLAKRGTCLKKQVGCVAINKKGHIISSGYNGQARGLVHCTVESPCGAWHNPDASCFAIHAEMNMLMRCPDIDDIDTVYITEKPCDKCLLSIQNTACKNIIYSIGALDAELRLHDEKPLI